MIPAVAGTYGVPETHISQPSGYPQEGRGGGTAVQSHRDDLYIEMRPETPNSLFVFERRG
jgi:hypothetical protein